MKVRPLIGRRIRIGRRLHVNQPLPRLRNHNATDDGARGENVSGEPAHQHQYITVGVNTPIVPLVRVELHS